MTVAVPVPPEVRVRLPGLTVAVKPDGETDVENETVPAKPPRLASDMLEVPEEPSLIVKDVGTAEIEKSTTLTVNVTEWVRPEPVPVINTE